MKIITPAAITNDVASPVTRASTATYFDKNGTLQTAPPNTLRVTYDPADLKAAPYVFLEGSATNFISYSSLRESAGVYSIFGASVTDMGVIAGSVGPDGTSGVRRFTVANPDGYSTARFGDTGSGTAGVTYAGSIFIRTPDGAARDVSIDCCDGTTRVVTADGEWRRFEIYGTNSASTNYRFMDIQFQSNGDYELFGAQISDRGGSYIPNTTNSPITRAADVLSSTYGLLYSNLTENDTDDAPLWISGQAVDAGLYRRRTETHRVYRALQAVPSSVTATPESNPLDANGNPYWLDWSPTKRWACLDTALATQSTAQDEITYVIRPGSICTGLAVLECDATDVRVSLVGADGSLVYRSTKYLLQKNSRSILDFLLRPIDRRPDEVFLDIPPFKEGIFTITIRKPGSTAKVGDIKLGRVAEVGELLVEPEIRYLRRSVIKDDGYGRTSFQKRFASKLLSAQVYIDGSPAHVDSVVRYVQKQTDQPCVMIGDEAWSSMIILGFVEDFQVTLPTRNGANCTLKAQGIG